MDPAIVEKYHAIEVPVKWTMGYGRYVEFEGETFTVTAAFCKHEVEIALYLTGREGPEDLSAVICCPVCGYSEELAQLILTPARQATHNDYLNDVFGWTARRPRRGRGPAWGDTTGGPA